MKRISELVNTGFLNNSNLYGIFEVCEDENLSEMARVGKIPNTIFEIHIEGGEGKTPHMYICSKSRKNVFLRICIEKK